VTPIIVPIARQYVTEEKLKLDRGITRLRSTFLRAIGLASRFLTPARGTWKGRAAPTDKSVIYAHFDPTGIVHEYTIYQLKQFVALDYGVTFVTNSPRLATDQLNKLLPLCVNIIWRRNRGHDFAAYREGILSLRSEEPTQLVLTNDSCYGPFYPLETLINRCSSVEADVWGATDSCQIDYHLQSYFLLFHKAAIKHRAFQRFWRSYPDVNDKTWVVLNGELGLSKRLVNAELRLAAAYPCKDAEARLRNTEHDRSLHIDFAAFLIGFRGRASELNPTRYYWETLIKREGFPFLKRHIFRGDSRFAFGVDALSVIGSESKYDTALISSHVVSCSC
jgi:lipopolysaccharide biosynthesis protein